MIEEPGRVVRTDGERAEVEVVPAGACGHCSAAGVCNWTGKREKTVVARNQVGAKAGDAVVLSRSEKHGAASALLVFGLPALLLVAGVVCGSLFLNDVWAGILAGVGLALGALVVLLANRAAARSGRGLPEIVQIASGSEYEGVNDEGVVADGGDVADSGAGKGRT
uniref:Fis family transcriptional regulator n=1 Tax=candidate division WOR-3 bacterium TaxID=2052148 RepID=A0A7C4GIX1_UNCW3